MPAFNQVLCQQFRNDFIAPSFSNLKWFPGHMFSSLKKMQSKLKSVDCVIEVHDARIPISGRNPNFRSTLLGLKPHILVLNKADLFDSTYKELVLRRLQVQGLDNVLFTACNKQSTNVDDLKQLKTLIKELIQSSNRFNRSQNREYAVMIIGVPNVGKSTLINSLRNKFLKKGSAAPVGPKAGVTRAVQTRIQICPAPPVYVIDTPGILTPDIKNAEIGLKLALCSTLNDNVVGYITMADYLIYWCNKHQFFGYMDYFNIKEPSDNTKLLLLQYAIEHNLYHSANVVDGSGTGRTMKPSVSLSAYHFIEAFRLGRFGPILLDMDIIL